MAKKRSKLERFQTEIAALETSITEDLRLPSLRENRLEGFAAMFVVVLPLLNYQGESVFTEALLQELFLALASGR